MSVTKSIAHFETTLVDAIDSTSTTLILDSVSTPAGNLPAGTYGFVLEQESTAKREYLIGTLSGSTLTFTLRDVSPLDGKTADSSSDTDRQKHRKGSSIKLTDHPVLAQVARILSGEDELDADTPIVLDASRTPTSANELATKGYVDATVSGGSVYFETQIVRGDAGETVTTGALVYLKETDGEWYLVNTTTDTDWKNKKLGMTMGAGTDGNPVGGGGVLRSGLDNNITYTAGQLYYGTDVAGVIGTSAGTFELVIGVGDANNKLLFFNDPYHLTDDEKDALAGSQGLPTDSNRFITQDNTTKGDVDQEQTTNDGTIEVGEADTTSNKNEIAQSFINSKTKIKGFTLTKEADTGTFTGTVTVDLKADSAGDPTGSALATVTISNNDWGLLSDNTSFEKDFGTEYASIVVGDTYHLVISSSTADNSNHINLGTNTAGGYANGSVKYNNTTDGWVAITTIDLTFSTTEGNNNQIVKTNASGKIKNELLDQANFDIRPYSQVLLHTAVTDYAFVSIATSEDGSVIIAADSDDYFSRYERNTAGYYQWTHWVDANTVSGGQTAVVGNYIYYSDGTNIQRLDLATISNKTQMSGTAAATNHHLWNAGGGKLGVQTGGATSDICTISGTVLTVVSSPAFAVGGLDSSNSYNYSEFTGYVYRVYQTGANAVLIYTDPADLSGVGTGYTGLYLGADPRIGAAGIDPVIIPISKTLCYVAIADNYYDGATNRYIIRLLPFVIPTT